MRILRNSLLAGLAVVVLLLVGIYGITYHPEDVEAVEVDCEGPVERYDEIQPLSVMVYNVQYFAGKNYVFYYDLPGEAGPDRRPSTAVIKVTLDGIAELIQRHNPDVLLLQEVDEDAAVSDHQDQTEQLLQRLPEGSYPCRAEAFYWKAGFVPHPDVMGSVGRKLTTLSRFQLEDAQRHQLPRMPLDPITAQFHLKRAVLTAGLATEQGNRIVLLNTHLSAFAQGTDTMVRQVARLAEMLKGYDDDNQPWLLGGDLNLLAPDQYDSLPEAQRYYYVEPTELKVLLQHWSAVPSMEDIEANPKAWYTHFPNDQRVDEPDRTIDYLFYSNHFQVRDSEVVQTEQAWELSDHLPIRIELGFSPR